MYRLPSVPDRVTMRVHMRPFDFDLLDDLGRAGDLDPTILKKVPRKHGACTCLARLVEVDRFIDSLE